MVEVNVEVPQEVYDWLVELAAENGTTPEECALRIMKGTYDRFVFNRKADRFRAQDYSYRVFWPEEDQVWISTSPEFMHLSNIDEDSQLDAFAGMVGLVQSVLDDIYDEGKEPPAPFWTRQESSEPIGDKEAKEQPADHDAFKSEEEAMELAECVAAGHSVMGCDIAF